MATREEIDALKRDWLRDPGWDLEETEGYEAHREELLAFHLAHEAQNKERREAKALNDYLNRPVTEMTVRDYFAAGAMQGYLAAHAGDDTTLPKISNVVSYAVRCADALLVALRKPKDA